MSLTLRFVVVLLSFGFASSSGTLAHAQSDLARAYRVILLDNSLSMQAVRSDGRTRFDAAMGTAQKLLSLFPPGDGVSLITTAQPAEVLIGSPTFDRRMAKEILSGVTATQQTDDAVAAIVGRIRQQTHHRLGNRQAVRRRVHLLLGEIEFARTDVLVGVELDLLEAHDLRRDVDFTVDPAGIGDGLFLETVEDLDLGVGDRVCVVVDVCLADVDAALPRSSHRAYGVPCSRVSP